MKIYISALPLTIGVILQFGVSSSMVTSPGNHAHNRIPPQFEYNLQTGRLIAIVHNGLRHVISSVMEREPSDNYPIPDGAYLERKGNQEDTAKLVGNGFKSLRAGCCPFPLSRTVHPRQDDVVVLGGFQPLGIYMNDNNGRLHFHIFRFPPI